MSRILEKELYFSINNITENHQALTVHKALPSAFYMAFLRPQVQTGAMSMYYH